MGLKCLFGHKWKRILYGNWKLNYEHDTEIKFAEFNICEKCEKESVMVTDIYGHVTHYQNPEALASIGGAGDEYREQIKLFKEHQCKSQKS